MRTLLVDNHDSYTYNVFHLLAGVSGEEPIVVDNDAVSWRALSRWDFDAIVLSPGRAPRALARLLRLPRHPPLQRDPGARHLPRPPGLGNLLDGKVSSAPEAMHGRLSRIRHEDAASSRASRRTSGRPLPLAGDHRRWARRPRHRLGRRRRGDGDRTPRGRCGASSSTPSRSPPSTAPLVAELLRAGAEPRSPRWRGAKRPRGARPRRSPRTRRAATSELRLRTIPGEPSTEALFERLFGDAEHAFWLDSADAPTRLAQRSFIGTSAGATRCVLEYDVESGPRSGTAPRRDQSSAPRSSTCSTASSPSTRSSHRRPTRRPD
jgi:para-aminobenzoate synthetase